jgi:hypothetical protein
MTNRTHNLCILRYAIHPFKYKGDRFLSCMYCTNIYIFLMGGKQYIFYIF